MKFGQLIEYNNTRNIFLVKSYKKFGGETSPRHFSKNSISSGSLDLQSDVSYSFFLLYVHVLGYQNILKLRCSPLAFASYKTFLQNKKRLELVSLPHFLYDFWRKIYLELYSIKWPFSCNDCLCFTRY